MPRSHTRRLEQCRTSTNSCQFRPGQLDVPINAMYGFDTTSLTSILEVQFSAIVMSTFVFSVTAEQAEHRHRQLQFNRGPIIAQQQKRS
jgi:hypothetical protein